MKNSSTVYTPSKNWFWLLVIAGLVTLGLHSYLSSQHYNIKLGINTGRSICNISATFNCDTVAASIYSSVFNVPVALFGFLAQAVLLILIFTAHFSLSEYSSNIRRICFWLSAMIALVSIIMGFISTFFLGTFCLFCIGTYLLSFASVFAAWKFQTESPLEKLSEDLISLFSRIRWVLVLIIAIPGLAWMSNAIIMDNYGLSRLNAMVDEEMLLWDQATQANLSDQGLVWGSSLPTKMTIVEFADFLCPHCKAASPTLEAFVGSHKDVKFIFKTFPLDGKCNKAITHSGDGFRCQLAAASLCAESMNKQGWNAHHWIFENQEKFMLGYDADVAIRDLASQLNLNEKDLKACVAADATYEMIQAIAHEGELAKIEGTPTIFVNGKKLQRGQFLPVLQKLHEKITGI